MRLKNMYNIIQDYQYISFDLFDTLLKRKVDNPEDIFGLMEIKLGYPFKTRRIRAEECARKEYSREITLDDIYKYFPEDKRGQLKKLEIETELKMNVANNDMYQLYRWCIESGKAVFITSDMYLPKSVIAKMILPEYEGYKGLYISGDIGKTKRSGGLYKYIIDREKISSDELLHIGDSIIADYIVPVKMGIHAIRIPGHTPMDAGRTDQQSSLIKGYGIGYHDVGKLLYDFVSWVYRKAKAKGIKKIYFLSRDGYLAKKAYDICITDKTIHTDYLEVSRRSLKVPCLWMCDSYLQLTGMLSSTSFVSVDKIFDGLGLDIKEYSDIISACGLSRSMIFSQSQLCSDKRIRRLICSIKNDIFRESKSEYDHLLKYLEQKGVSGRFGIVDLGYHGSMQKYLDIIINQSKAESDIYGFYLGIESSCARNITDRHRLNMQGFLFDHLNNRRMSKNNTLDSVKTFASLLETIFLEEKGSVKCYEESDGRLEVVRYPYEFDMEIKTGKMLLIHRYIQKGALDYVRNASNVAVSNIETSYGIIRIGRKATLSEVNLLGDIPFYDEGVYSKLAAPESIWFYIMHPLLFKRDFIKCTWRIGFLRRLFKVRLPYEWIYNKAKGLIP